MLPICGQILQPTNNVTTSRQTYFFFSDLPCESAATVLEMIQSGVKTQRAAESPSGACVSL